MHWETRTAIPKESFPGTYTHHPSPGIKIQFVMAKLLIKQVSESRQIAIDNYSDPEDDDWDILSQPAFPPG